MSLRIENRLATIIFSILFTYPSILISQSKFSLAPGIGRQALQCYVKEDLYADKGFGTYNFSTTSSFNLSLQLDIKNNWLIFVGWNTSRSTINYKHGNTAISRMTLLRFPSMNFPIGIQKKLSTHHWIKFKENKNFNKLLGMSSSTEERYLLLFRSRIIAGFSYDKMKNFPGNLNSLQGNNASIFLGLGLHFFDYANDRLQLNFLYSLGLKEIGDVNIEYSFEGKNYFGKIGSRGSFFAVQFAYPIKLLNL